MTLKWDLLCEKMTRPHCLLLELPRPGPLTPLASLPLEAQDQVTLGGGARGGEGSYRSCNSGRNLFFWLLEGGEEGRTGRGGPFRTNFSFFFSQLVTHNAIK